MEGVRALRDTERVLNSFADHGRVFRNAGRHALYDIGVLFEKTLKDGIKRGPKTGRYYKYKGRRKKASSPGQYPANRSGQLRRSANFKVINERLMLVGMTKEYAIYLEDGTWKMKPRPAMDLTENRIRGKAEAIARRRLKEGLKVHA